MFALVWIRIAGVHPRRYVMDETRPARAVCTSNDDGNVKAEQGGIFMYAFSINVRQPAS
ncbi:hypothetical protein ACFPTO_14480 [Paraburkholderia denitrificans]|uniref:Uncharacterized protein n=1 Tax=Paraburkholderia denitrificans TaxID=694025 RepID=A0ABW0JA89_9BURK